MNRRRSLSLAVLVGVMAVFAWGRFATHDAPAGQRSLATLDQASLAALQADFNGAAGEVRIVVLLSPT